MPSGPRRRARPRSVTSPPSCCSSWPDFSEGRWPNARAQGTQARARLKRGGPEVRWSSLRAQLVPHAPHGDHAVAEGAKLLAQADNMAVDRAVDAIEAEAPDALQEVFAAV